jgi:transcriptional regulator GlxA family with amidase domain
MYKVNILTSENALFSTVFGPYDMFLQAGVFWNAINEKALTPFFEVHISSIDGGDICGMAGAKITPHKKADKEDQYDIVLIPSEGMNVDPDSESFIKRVEYINLMHSKGAVIASICTGAFLIAATGLLNNKTATTHWAFEQLFKRYYPEIEIKTDLLIADNDQIITAGGVTADQDLSMHIISRFCGHEIALQTARCTLIDRTTREQKPYRTFAVEKNHGDDNILNCQNYIDKNLSGDISIQELSKILSMSERTLVRRFKAATGHSLVNYIQQLRIEKSKYILERNNISFDEIAHNVGYENVSFFRRLFKKNVGITPKEYKRMFFKS